MSDVFTLGGRKFKAVANSTIEHDYCTVDCLRAAGIDVVDMRNDQSPEDFVRDLLSKVHRSGKLFSILAHLLIPADKQGHDWSPEVAAETEAFIKKLTDPADKQAINSQIVAALIGFFQAGLISVRTTQSYSQAKQVSQPGVGQGRSTESITETGTSL